MSLKVMQLTEEQVAELEAMQAELMQMFEANPDKPGAILAQIFPRAGTMRVRVAGPDIVPQLAKVLLAAERAADGGTVGMGTWKDD